MRLCTSETIATLRELLARYSLKLLVVEEGEQIPGSYWGESEAGIVGNNVYIRPDTPLHSALHEACHVVCMDPVRRAQLHTDAGGDYAEEDAVCYLQIILAGELGLPISDTCADLDAWGYTFRLGSAQAWFERDAIDAQAWLVCRGVISEHGAPTYRLRGA